MDLEVSYTLENEQQFWDELDDIVSVDCQSHELIDNALRSYLAFIASFKGEYVRTEYDLARCAYMLIAAKLFAINKDYVRTQIIYCLLQEDSPDTLHVIVTILLLQGRQDEETFRMMSEEGAFPRLLDLILGKVDDDAGLHRMLLELLYDMSRIQRLRIEDLILIEDEFLIYMFRIIEELSDDVNDPYHYPVIRVVLILNEQYMVCAHDPSPDQPQSPTTQVTNKVISILSVHGPRYKTFGENIILLLNRESETSLQLLILKLLYLLFTTRATYEYFYTNDLHVLLDIILRNLLDLPPSSTALRHTYLRVLYPLLSHTQLKHPPHYKRDDLLQILAVMGGGAVGHFGAIDDTTKRLIGRCIKVPWLKQETLEPEGGANPIIDRAANQRLLNVSQPSAMESSLSVVEVAAQTSVPGEQTPSLKREEEQQAKCLGSGHGEGPSNEEEKGVKLDDVPLKTLALDDNNVGNLEVVVKSPFEVEGEA